MSYAEPRVRDKRSEDEVWRPWQISKRAPGLFVESASRHISCKRIVGGELSNRVVQPQIVIESGKRSFGKDKARHQLIAARKRRPEIILRRRIINCLGSRPA